MITISQLRESVPAAFTDRPAPHVSEKYNFIPTSKVLDHLFDRGFEVVRATQQASRDISDVPYAKHRIELRPNYLTGLRPDVGTVFPMISLTNSHNWQSRFMLREGIYRLVCGNGMTVSEAEFGSFTVRHDSVMDDLETILASFSDHSEKMMDTVDRWAKIHLDKDERFQFARAAAEVRYGETANDGHAIALLTVRRRQDEKSDLWTIYNQVQENGVRGGIKAPGMKRRARSLSNIDALNSFNEELYELASNVALAMS